MNMEYHYRTTSVTIGNENFDVDTLEEIKKMFLYCEKRFGFKGDEWEEIKGEFDYEGLGEMVENTGVYFSENLSA